MADPLRILLIEDDTGHARLIQELLKDAIGENWAIHRACRLEEAFEYARASGVDVVLMDLSLPDTSGGDTLDRAKRALPGIPLIVISSNDDPELAVGLRRAGASGYLVKGRIETSDLVKAIREAVDPPKV